MKNEISEQDLADLKEKCLSISGEIKMKKITWEKAIEKNSTKNNDGPSGVLLMNQLEICIGTCKI